MKPQLVALILVALFAEGCSVYRPSAALPSSYKTQVITDVTKSDLLPTYNKMSDTTAADAKLKVERRNQILTELIYLVDNNYYNFENRFHTSQAAFSTGADAVNLGLTAAASVTGTAELKSVLAAITTANTGFKTSVEKNFFDQQTRGAIVTKMRSLRAVQLATIQDATHMKAAASAYGLEQGLSDVSAYFEAGTLVGASQGIAASVGADTKKATDQQDTNNKTQQLYQ